MKIQVMIVGVVAIFFAFVKNTEGVTRAQMENLSRGFRNTCARKVHADMALVEGIRKGQFPEGNSELKCYTKCIMILMKTLKNGKADLNAVIKQVNAMASDDVADKLIDAATKCHSDVTEKDLCEYTWKYTKCTYEADPENFFFP